MSLKKGPPEDFSRERVSDRKQAWTLLSEVYAQYTESSTKRSEE